MLIKNSLHCGDTFDDVKIGAKMRNGNHREESFRRCVLGERREDRYRDRVKGDLKCVNERKQNGDEG